MLQIFLCCDFHIFFQCQVQKLIEAQNISPSNSNSKENISMHDGSHISKDDIEPSTEDDLQRVREVTVKQLNEMINKSNDR